jgi:two-component system sensor histidine kinase GlrK
VGNLLSNAIRFSPEGGVIRITLTRQPGCVRMDFMDQGPGVHENDRSRIFEPFYRGVRQPADAARGSGIGLSIVQEYIQAHGGRVEVMQDGPRTFFRIELVQ